MKAKIVPVTAVAINVKAPEGITGKRDFMISHHPDVDEATAAST